MSGVSVAGSVPSGELPVLSIAWGIEKVMSPMLCYTRKCSGLVSNSSGGAILIAVKSYRNGCSAILLGATLGFGSLPWSLFGS